MRLNRVDLLLIMLGIVLIVASSYQLIFTGSLFTGEGIGLLKTMEQTVKTRQGSDLFWSTPFLGSAIQDNQLLFTAQASTAQILLNDGNSINVGENSLIKVKSSSLNFIKGELRTTLAGKALEIQVGERTLSLSSANSAQVAIQQSGETTLIGVVSGNVEVSDGQKTVRAGNAQLVEVGAKQLSVKGKLEISPQPASLAIFYTKNKKMDIEFGDYPGDIYLSNISGFKNAKKISQQRLSLVPGSYWWRVLAEDAESILYHFKIVADVAPEIYRPLDQSSIKTTLPSELNLQWDSLNYIDALLEIKHEGIVSQETVSHGLFSLVMKKEGEYQWRVKHVIKNHSDSTWSPWQTFTIKDLSLDIPQNLAPLNYQVKTYDLAKEAIDFSWVYSGEVLFSVSDKDGEIFSQKIEKNSYSWKPKVAGDFTIKLRALDNPLHLWSEEAKVRVQDLSTIKDVAVHTVELAKPDQEVDFQWKGEKGEYLFELSGTQDFREIIISKGVKSPETKVNIPQVGTYYWRSRIRENGKWRVSPPRRVVIRPTPGPSRPRNLPSLKLPLRLKKTTQVFTLFTRAFAQGESFVKIKLPKVEDAKLYKLEIFEDENLEKLIFTKKSKKNNITWPDARGGKFFYRYSIIDFWERESESSEASVLEVTASHLIPKQVNDLKVEVVGETIEVHWKKDALSAFYRLELANNQEFKNPQILTTSELTHSFKVSPGQYFLKVTALNDFGVSKSVNRKIEVLLKDNVLIAAEKNQLFTLYRPSMDRLKFKDKESGSIDGETLAALELRFERNDKFLSILKADYIMGSVFAGESYNSYSLEGAIDYFVKDDVLKFSIGPLAKFWHVPVYMVKDKVVAQSESYLVAGAHARISGSLKFFDLVFDQYLYALNVTGILSELSARKSLNDISIFSAIAYENIHWSNHRKSSLIVKLGLGISF